MWWRGLKKHSDYFDEKTVSHSYPSDQSHWSLESGLWWKHENNIILSQSPSSLVNMSTRCIMEMLRRSWKTFFNMSRKIKQCLEPPDPLSLDTESLDSSVSVVNVLRACRDKCQMHSTVQDFSQTLASHLNMPVAFTVFTLICITNTSCCCLQSYLSKYAMVSMPGLQRWYLW